MKNLFFCLTLLSISLTQAQSDADNPWSLALKGGLNVTTFAGDVTDEEYAAGFNAGIAIERKLTEKWALQGEVVFSVQGAKFEGPVYLDEYIYDMKDHYKLSYINVPVLAKFYATPRLNFFAGPQVGFLVEAAWRIEYNNGLGDSGEGSINVKNQFKSTDVAAVLGLGCEITKKFYAEARYNMGVTNASDIPDISVQNRVFQFGVAYRIL